MCSREPKVGIVIPAFREAEGIGALLTEVRKCVPDVEIVVVDDSPDEDTVAAVRSCGFSNVTVTHRKVKGGRGSAVLAGMRQLLDAGCEQIVEMDADFSHPPGQIPALLMQARADKLDLLIASRYAAGSQILNWPLSRRIFSAASNHLARRVLRIPVHDYTNGFRVYSRAAAELIVEECGRMGKGFIALSEILVNLHSRHFTIGETATVFPNRVRGESSLNTAEISSALVGLFRIWLLQRRLRARNVRVERKH